MTKPNQTTQFIILKNDLIMKKNIHIIFFVLLPLLIQSQIYTSANYDTTKKYISAGYSNGTIILNDGTALEGQVRASVYKGNNVSTFKYRLAKGDKAQKFTANNCSTVIVNGVQIVSLPKKFKKPEGKKRFYVAIYHGENFSVFEDPKASVVNARPGEISFNNGQMLSMLAFKNNELTKLNKFNFRRKMRKICNDSSEWNIQAEDKKWFKYDNIFSVASFYNESISENKDL